jgi:hypothetical protein
MKTYRRAYLDCWFVVAFQHAEAIEERARLEFTAFKIESLNEPSEEPELAQEPYAAGYIKFDGCADITFQSELHFCGPGMMQQHCTLLAELYKEAATVFNDPELAPVEPATSPL